MSAKILRKKNRSATLNSWSQLSDARATCSIVSLIFWPVFKLFRDIDEEKMGKREENMMVYQSGGWQSLRRPRSRGDFEDYDFWKNDALPSRLGQNVRSQTPVKMKRPTGRPSAEVRVLEKWRFPLRLRKNRDFLKIKKMPQKATFVRRNRFKNEKNLYNILCSTGTPLTHQLC